MFPGKYHVAKKYKSTNLMKEVINLTSIFLMKTLQHLSPFSQLKMQNIIIIIINRNF